MRAAGHNTVFAGGAGDDTLNAAAVDDASTINLNTGTLTIDGVAGTFSSLETFFTGDGNDTITGTNANATLHTGRGRDQIVGGSGNETIFAGAGNDSISPGLGNDFIEVGSGEDEMDGGICTDTLSYRNSSAAVIVSLDTGTGLRAMHRTTCSPASRSCRVARTTTA